MIREPGMTTSTDAQAASVLFILYVIIVGLFLFWGLSMRDTLRTTRKLVDIKYFLGAEQSHALCYTNQSWADRTYGWVECPPNVQEQLQSWKESNAAND